MIDKYSDMQINQSLDVELNDCPTCKAKYCLPSRRLGPTCLPKFKGKKVHVICMVCHTKSLPFKTQQQAIDGWNAGEIFGTNSEDGLTKFERARLEKGFTQIELAKALGVSESMVHKICKGRQQPNDEIKPRLVKALGIRVS